MVVFDFTHFKPIDSTETTTQDESVALSQPNAPRPVNKPFNPVIHAFLSKRGLTEDAVAYLTESRAEHQHNPFLLDGMEHWIDELHKRKGEQIAIQPDYDADGVLSGTLLRSALYLFGFGTAYLYAPKTSDGYGLTPKAVDNIFEACPHATTLITTDNGSNAYEGVRYAKERGWSVLVTDHHVTDADPVADAVLNPNRRHRYGVQQYPFTDISGTAVIYKAMRAYFEKYVNDPAIEEQLDSLLLLVGMSTISDVMPLLNENRYFVTESVRMLERFVASHTPERALAHPDNPLGDYWRGMDRLVATLNEHNKLKYGVNSDTFGFTIGPMLNSPRRMLGDSARAFDLFRTGLASSERPSDELFVLNESRKAYVNQLRQRLFDHIEDHEGVYPVDCTIFTAEMVGGVAGLLSSAFTGKYDLPSIAFTVPAASWDVPTDRDPINVDVSGVKRVSGSARSPEWFNIHAFIKQIEADYPDLIIGWGGHPQAAGITLKAENYAKFRGVFTTRLHAILREQFKQRDDSSMPFPLPVSGEFLLGTDTVYAICKGYTHPLPFEVIDVRGNRPIMEHESLLDAVRFFAKAAPFGQGFPEPIFNVAFSMADVKVFYMGSEKQHAKLTLPNGLSVIHWNSAETFRLTAPEGVSLPPDHRVFCMSGRLSINEYNGRESLQMIVDAAQEIE